MLCMPTNQTQMESFNNEICWKPKTFQNHSQVSLPVIKGYPIILEALTNIHASCFQFAKQKILSQWTPMVYQIPM